MENIMENIDRWVEKVIVSMGVSEGGAPYLRLLALLLVVGLLSGSFLHCQKIGQWLVVQIYKKDTGEMG